MTLEDRIRALLATAPDPTPQEREEQMMSLAYSNLQISEEELTPEAFRNVALERGWTLRQFSRWAVKRGWGRSLRVMYE